MYSNNWRAYFIWNAKVALENQLFTCFFEVGGKPAAGPRSILQAVFNKKK
jgi:hypothetical protein